MADQSAKYYRWPPADRICGGCGKLLFFGALMHINCVAVNKNGDLDEMLVRQIKVLELDGSRAAVMADDYKVLTN